MTWRSRIVLADISFSSTGDVLVVVSDGSINSVIKCFTVNIQMNLHRQITINCQSTEGLFAKCHTDSNLCNMEGSRITHLKFLSLDTGDQLLVSAGCNSASCIELWGLVEQYQIVHALFQQTMERATHKWVHKATVPCNSIPISIAVPRFPIVYSTPEPINPMLQYVAIAYKDGSVKLVNKRNFAPMTSTNLDTGVSLSDTLGNDKRRRVMPYLVHMQQALSGCCLVGINQNSCLYMMKAVNTRDPVTEIPMPYLVGMLEYLMSTGYDWWDVLASLKPGRYLII